MSTTQSQAGNGMNTALIKGTHPHQLITVCLAFARDLELHAIYNLSVIPGERAESGFSHIIRPYHDSAILEIE